MPKRSPASPSSSLSRPGHLEHWVVGQAGRLGAQEANPGQCGRPGLTESWKGKTSPSSAQADMQSFANGLTGPARSHSARDPLPALSLPLSPQRSQNSEMKPTWSPLSQRTEKRRHGRTHARTHARTGSHTRTSLSDSLGGNSIKPLSWGSEHIYYPSICFFYQMTFNEGLFIFVFC